MCFKFGIVSPKQAISVIDSQPSLIMPLKKMNYRDSIGHWEVFWRRKNFFRNRNEVVSPVARSDYRQPELRQALCRVRGDELLESGNCFWEVVLLKVARLEL